MEVLFGGMEEKRIQSLRMKYSSKIFLSILKSMVMLIPVPVIILIVVEIVALNTIQDTIEEYEDAIFEKVADELGADYESSLQLMRDIRTEEKLTQYLRQDERNYYIEYELFKILNQNIKRNSNIQEIYIYFPSYDYILSSSSSKDSREYHEKYYTNSYEEWIEELTEHMDSEIVMEENSQGETILVSGTGYESMNQAVVVIKLNTKYMTDRLKSICDNGEERAWLLYENQILAMTGGKKTADLPENILKAHWSNGDKIQIEDTIYRLKVRKIARNGLYLIYGAPEGIKYFAVETIKILAVGSVVLCLVILIWTAVMATNRNYAPIKRLFDILHDGNGIADEIDYEIMENYVENFRKQAKQMRMQIKGYEEDVKSLYLGKLLLTDTNRKVSSEQVEKWGFFGKYYVVVLYQFVEAEVEPGQEVPEDYRKDILEEYIKAYLKECVCCYVMEKNSKVYCVLNGNGESDVIFCDAVRERNKEIVENLTKVENLYCDAYMSGCFMNLNEIHQGYYEVNQVKKRQINSEQEEISENNCSIEKVKNGIQENLLDVNLSVASLAELLNITPSYLSRFFKRNTGMGVLEYIHECRIEKAKEIMSENPEAKAKEVAEKVGFANLATFIRVFKKKEGITPGQFRDSMQK